MTVIKAPGTLIKELAKKRTYFHMWRCDGERRYAMQTEIVEVYEEPEALAEAGGLKKGESTHRS